MTAQFVWCDLNVTWGIIKFVQEKQQPWAGALQFLKLFESIFVE